jgi:hypothetical protein
MCNLSYATTQICSCMCCMQLKFSCKKQLQNPKFLVVLTSSKWDTYVELLHCSMLIWISSSPKETPSFIDALLIFWKTQMWVPNRKHRKNKESGHAPWLVALWRGRGACWSSGMGLGRINKLHLLTRICTKPTQGGQCIVGAFLVLGRSIGNLDSQDSPQFGLGGNHHLPPYSILSDSSQGPHPNGFLSRDSQMGIRKFLSLGFLWLWGPITFSADLRLRWCLKKSCSPRWELSNGMWHVTWKQGNWVDSRLLVVGSQIANLTPNLSFDHNLCFRYPNGSCEPILDI